MVVAARRSKRAYVKPDARKGSETTSGSVAKRLQKEYAGALAEKGRVDVSSASNGGS